MTNLLRKIQSACLFVTAIGAATAQTNSFPASGNAGVGTTSPQRTLTVVASGGATLMVADSNLGTTASDGFQLQQIGGDSHLINEENGSLSLWTNATERMRIDSSGNVGIGTTTPQRALEIGVSDVAGVSFEKYTSSPTSGVLRFGDGTGWKYHIGRSRNSSGGALNSGAAGVIATFQDNGNVGIGTTSPDSRLQVDVDTNKEIRLAAGGSNALGDISVGGPGIVFSRGYDGSDNIAAIFQYSDSAGNNRLALATRDDLVFAAGGASIYTYAPERMRITSAGNVGIGTTTPGMKLDVGGSFRSTNNSPLASTGTGIEVFFQPAPQLGVIQAVDRSSSAHKDIRIGPLNYFMADGNVGIGTTNPTHKLAVNGTIRAKEVIVDNSWADYVFAEGYRLAPLDEVEQHIREKKHLPGIPSAAEVEAGGVSLGDMQVRLLAKIEELTLHLIELKRENEAMKSRLAHIESNLTP